MNDNVFAAPETDDRDHDDVNAGGDDLAHVMEPLIRAIGWFKFLGVMMIIGGVLSAITITGIIVAWVPIWLGVLLFQCAGHLERGRRSGAQSYREATDKIRLAAKIWGILMIVYMVLIVLVIGFALVAGVSAFAINSSHG